MRLLSSARLALALLVLPVVARADGAFPDSLAIFLPEDAPSRILVATNFGLLRTDDAGASWTYTCEEAIGTLANLYQLGPPPDGRLFAVSQDGLSVSSDTGCSWSFATGGFQTVTDSFPDPHDALHVLATGRLPAEAGGLDALFPSADGGATFGGPLLTATGGAVLTGVEIAKTDARAVAVTQYGDPTQHAVLLRSTDAGVRFTPTDLSATTGTDVARILAIDPGDAARVWLRVLGDGEDRLVLVDGDAVRVALQLDAPMTAFLRRADGTVLVGASNGHGWRSTDAGATFTPWETGLHLRGLGERSGRLYAVADDVVDGFAVGVSDDEGATWSPLLRLRDLKGPQACGDLATTCLYPWLTLQNLLAYADSDADTAAPPTDDGCGCTTGEGASLVPLVPLVPLALLAGLRRRVRDRSAPAPGTPPSAC